MGSVGGGERRWWKGVHRRTRCPRACGSLDLGSEWLATEAEGLIARARLRVDPADDEPQPSAAPSAEEPFGLTPRERQVLALLSKGWDNARIGRDLFISQHTVRTHIQNILEKLGMHSKLEAATFAMQNDLPTRRGLGEVTKLPNRRQRSRSASATPASGSPDSRPGGSSDGEDAPQTAS